MWAGFGHSAHVCFVRNSTHGKIGSIRGLLNEETEREKGEETDRANASRE